MYSNQVLYDKKVCYNSRSQQEESPPTDSAAQSASTADNITKEVVIIPDKNSYVHEKNNKAVH